ncbi:MAG: hypothetical protein HC941_24660, partial [Microcoleus sp. SU_5_3]|nr:hypothetical protein [Microcoleus sp. SU_5_3]
VDFTTGNFPISVSIGDINGDGKPDLAVANEGSNNVLHPCFPPPPQAPPPPPSPPK